MSTTLVPRQLQFTQPYQTPDYRNRLKRNLGNGVLFEADHSTGLCVTRYADGFSCKATREDTPDNRMEARDQGYRTAADGLWQSLVEHELAHTLLTRAIFGRESYVLRHESGAERNRYAVRLHEEALAISFQRYMNTDCMDAVLTGISPLLLHSIKQTIRS